MDMVLESEAQLLNGLPPPILRHQGQRYTFGTGVGDTRGQIDVGQGASTHFQYQQQATPVYPEYSYSAYMSDSAQPHRYYQHKPAPAPAAPLLSPESYGGVEVPRSQYFHSHGPYQRHLRAHIITRRHVIAHKYQSKLCTLFNLPTIRIIWALSHVWLMSPGLTLYRLDDCMGRCMSAFVIGIS